MNSRTLHDYLETRRVPSIMINTSVVDDAGDATCLVTPGNLQDKIWPMYSYDSNKEVYSNNGILPDTDVFKFVSVKVLDIPEVDVRNCDTLTVDHIVDGADRTLLELAKHGVAFINRDFKYSDSKNGTAFAVPYIGDNGVLCHVMIQDVSTEDMVKYRLGASIARMTGDWEYVSLTTAMRHAAHRRAKLHFESDHHTHLYTVIGAEWTINAIGQYKLMHRLEDEMGGLRACLDDPASPEDAVVYIKDTVYYSDNCKHAVDERHKFGLRISPISFCLHCDSTLEDVCGDGIMTCVNMDCSGMTALHNNAPFKSLDGSHVASSYRWLHSLNIPGLTLDLCTDIAGTSEELHATMRSSADELFHKGVSYKMAVHISSFFKRYMGSTEWKRSGMC